MCSAVPPTVSPSLANAVLQETVRANTIVGLPFPHGAPPSLVQRGVAAGQEVELSAPGWWSSGSATLPVLNAVELVISLNVEPGGNVSLIARFSSGWAGSLTSRLSILLNLTPSCVARAFGSKLG